VTDSTTAVSRGRDDRPVVAFDLMDTLLRDPFREALEAATDRPLRDLFRLRDPNVYPALERGELSEAEYWAAFADAGIDVDPEAFHRTRREGYAWLDGMRDLLADLDGRVRRVVASNYPIWVEEVAATWLHGLIDEVFASCHLRARKPDEAFYRGLCGALGVPPHRVLFVDDREDNVVGAREFGMAAVRFVDAASVRRALDDWAALT
jgi:HAD superfamily hydrolase (TIGR01509 family)